MSSITESKIASTQSDQDASTYLRLLRHRDVHDPTGDEQLNVVAARLGKTTADVIRDAVYACQHHQLCAAALESCARLAAAEGNLAQATRRARAARNATERPKLEAERIRSKQAAHEADDACCAARAAADAFIAAHWDLFGN